MNFKYYVYPNFKYKSTFYADEGECLCICSTKKEVFDLETLISTLTEFSIINLANALKHIGYNVNLFYSSIEKKLCLTFYKKKD